MLDLLLGYGKVVKRMDEDEDEDDATGSFVT
jgi:hypothetical protein